ncbi:MAG: hypothetical protein ACFBZ9_10820, partial [Sphingomonadales bacterium]
AKALLRAQAALRTVPQEAVPSAGKAGDEEFVLMVARRDESGGFAVLDTVEAGKSTVEAALKKAASKKKKTL